MERFILTEVHVLWKLDQIHKYIHMFKFWYIPYKICIIYVFYIYVLFWVYLQVVELSFPSKMVMVNGNVNSNGNSVFRNTTNQQQQHQLRSKIKKCFSPLKTCELWLMDCTRTEGNCFWEYIGVRKRKCNLSRRTWKCEDDPLNYKPLFKCSNV